MNSFVYRVPTEVIFGKKTEEQIGDILEKKEKKRAVLVYGSDRVKNSGLLGLIESKLDDKGIVYLEIGGDVETLPVAVLPPNEMDERAVPRLVREHEQALLGLELHVEVDVHIDAVTVRRRRVKTFVPYGDKVKTHEQRADERHLHEELLSILRKELFDLPLLPRELVVRRVAFCLN